MTGAKTMTVAAKHPPHSTESEQCLLGDLMRRPQGFYLASAAVSEDDFYLQDHRVIWHHVAKLAKAGKATDMVAVSESLRDSGELDGVGGMHYIGTLAVEATGYAENHAGRVRELAQRRRVIAFAQDLAEGAYTGQSSEELIGSVSTSMETLLRAGVAQSVRFSAMAEAALDAFTTGRRQRETGTPMGAQTGLPIFDRISGGFYGPRLIILAARPKCGKTALLNQLSITSALTGKAGFVCSIEMGAQETAARALALHGGINVTRLQRGEDREVARAVESWGKLGDLPLWFDFSTYWLDNIIAQIALHKLRHGIQWAAIDHIGLVRTRERFDSINNQLGHISFALKQAAKRLEIPIIALAQLGRSCDRERRRPRADDLRDSGNIEQDADMVLMIHVPLEERMKFVRRADIGITANRAGPSCWMPATYDFNGAVQLFTETPVESDQTPVPTHGPAPHPSEPPEWD